MKSLQGARVLFICPKYFSYDLAVTEALEARGARVDLVADRPRHDTLSKALIRLNRKWLFPMADAFFEQSIDWGARYDFVLVLIGESLSPAMLRRISAAFPDAKRVLYMWDSFNNKPALVDHIPHFHQVYSFDRSDADRFGVRFRPLFFLDRVTRWAGGQDDFDLSFVGTIHSDRYAVASRVFAQVPAERRFSYFYVQSRSVYLARCLLNADIRRAPREDFRFAPLPLDEVYSAIGRSRASIDIQHPRQTGLTIRTLETLALGRKLITTNPDVARYEFNDPGRVLIIDRQSPAGIHAFLDADMPPLDGAVRHKYSVGGWLEEVLA